MSSALEEAAALCRELGWPSYANRLMTHGETVRVFGIAVVEFDAHAKGFGVARHQRRIRRRLLARLLGALRRADEERGE